MKHRILFLLSLCLLQALPGRAERYWTGDISGNGDAEHPRITAKDQVLMVRILRGRIPAVPAADINGDKVVDMNDLALLEDIIMGRRDPEWKNAAVSVDGEGSITVGGNLSDQDTHPRQDVKPKTQKQP